MTHRFYCPQCSHYLYASTVPRLAGEVNKHNEGMHPFEGSEWRPADIVNSNNYQECEDDDDHKLGGGKPYEPRAHHVVAKPVPVTLNADDTEFLSSLGVKW